MHCRFFIVDAFTPAPFAGNPAVVCWLPHADAPWPGDALLQNVAGEFNLSETAFVRPSERGHGDFDLRWFTPVTEVDLCGHGTLAAAHVLFNRKLTGPHAHAITFHTHSGPLRAAPAEKDSPLVWLTFPEEDPAVLQSDVLREEALTSLGLESAVWVGANRLDVLVEVGSFNDVRACRPNLALIAELPYRGIILTAPARQGVLEDFVSRFFAPSCGINEDPVTGSAHCALAPYWARKLGRTRLCGRQLSHRGGLVHTELEGSHVRLGGESVIVAEGELSLPQLLGES